MMNRRKRLFWWVILACTIILSSCNEDEPVNVEDFNKQTILVYMPWSGDSNFSGLYNFFKENLDSIESGIKAQKGLRSSRLVVFLSKSATESKLYEVRYENNVLVHKPIKTYSGHPYTTASGIAEIINDTKSAAEALNYAMIIGCHGTGWTYKANWKNYPYQAKRYHFMMRQPASKWERTRFFGSVSDLENYATDIEVLAEGIAQTGTKMQYVMFDDCYMANIETAYMLKDVCNFLIGSTSEIIAIGMPYASMWASLATPTPNYATAVSKFHEFYSNYTVPCGTIAVIDCRKVEGLANVMRDINSAFTLDDALRDSIQVLDGFNPNIFFDLGDYVDKLCQDERMKAKFNDQLAKVVRCKSATGSVYSYLYGSPKYIKVKHFSGITISDPTLHVAPSRGLRKTGWWKATH
ncbi:MULTISPECIES: clostripain-related cysteine peptidase [Prevotellaceae]|uniref:clostripain-related cysteine peptidase n=1 Tax=Prevotellaceae TaxID=171552 RepID=UPI00050EEEB3|nr:MULTISPECIES: clostripain-related cysteine peptidase [Prevotellaceae]KGF42400.1 hypothetical protein HMPREF2140_01455 [Hoylesella buccalis DNF00985]